jgi:hypothetical protein
MVHHERPPVVLHSPGLLVAAILALGVEALLGHAGLDSQGGSRLPDGTCEGILGRPLSSRNRSPAFI